ncbi:MAG: TIGR01777 family protein, partial [Anaerolineae bacterium]|nr:TIGR01777 family protein [Anaerolineae bacterium]
MRIVILGGTGLIGKAFTNEMIRAHHELVIVTRSPESMRSQTGVAYARWNGRNAEGWAEHVDGADAIVNLAGENIGGRRWTAQQKKRILESRLSAGAAVVAAVKQAVQKPRIVFQVSGVGYYGILNPAPCDEQAAPGDDFLARVSQAWEESTREVESMGVRRVIGRTGAVLSLEGGALPRMLLPFRLLTGGPLGSGKQWLSWIHIKDQVRAMRFLLESETASGVYNLTSPEPVTNAVFGRCIGKVLRRPYWIPAPGFALRLVLGEMSTLVLDGQQVIPQRLLDE